MKNLTKTLVCASLLLCCAQAFSFSMSGNVVCDVNNDGLFDAEDAPIANVNVIIEGSIYGSLTETTDVLGMFSVCLHCNGAYDDTYMLTLDPATLGAMAEVVQPASGAHIVTLDFTTPEFHSVDFLVNDPVCRDDVEIGEGCTPGYWKQNHHFDSWPSAYTPETLFADVFEDAFPNMTLLEVLRQGGGGIKALGRHTVAALLNATSTDVGYNEAAASVIADFNAAYLSGEYEQTKDDFAGMNESFCPLN